MNKYQYLLNEGYTIDTDRNRLDIPWIHQFLSIVSYWAKDVPIETVNRSIEHSLCFGIFYFEQQVGFARVVTDQSTFAYLADVFIIDEHRGKGLSKWLLENIHSHPHLQGLRRWILVTKDAQGLYQQFGWEPIPEVVMGRFMQIHQPTIYQTGKASTQNSNNQ
ncbi:MAG: GNAT family N-acetyltransferase [Chitinophagaceae bacterium]|nr:GNAT family N-acetyltransferase [Chitinophagaceae bacterium]